MIMIILLYNMLMESTGSNSRSGIAIYSLLKCLRVVFYIIIRTTDKITRKNWLYIANPNYMYIYR